MQRLFSEISLKLGPFLGGIDAVKIVGFVCADL